MDGEERGGGNGSTHTPRFFSAPSHTPETVSAMTGIPMLLTADEVAGLLRVSRKAVYMMTERGELPGVVRIGTRLRFCRDDLLHWLDESRAPSPKEHRR